MGWNRCVWRSPNVRLMGWKRKESEPKKNCSIVAKRVLPAGPTMNLKSIWVHCVFWRKKSYIKLFQSLALISNVSNWWLMSIFIKSEESASSSLEEGKWHSEYTGWCFCLHCITKVRENGNKSNKDFLFNCGRHKWARRRVDFSSQSHDYVCNHQVCVVMQFHGFPAGCCMSMMCIKEDIRVFVYKWFVLLKRQA